MTIPTPARPESTWQRLSRTPVLRLLMMASVIIVLQIPLLLIGNQIDERHTQKNIAVQDITEKWGGRQAVVGPLLIVPYLEHLQHRDKNGKIYYEAVRRQAGFLPDHLTIDTSTKHETRQRGLFEVPLYRSDISLTGNFAAPAFDKWSVTANNILWQEATLVMLVSDAHAITERTHLQWNKQRVYLEAGAGPLTDKHNGYHVTVGRQAAIGGDFQIQLKLNGSEQLHFAPAGNDSVIRMQSNWPDPSFIGQWLPTTRNVTANGFNSEWRIAAISRGYGQQWKLHADNHIDKMQQGMVGVDFLVSIDNYRMSERSSKYDFMFLLLTFLVVWLMEVITRERVHFIQYLLLGTALSLFYLLLTALSEHIGFYTAYALASLAVIITITLYSKSVLKSWKRGATIGGVITALYAYLFSLLNEQNYAFVIGSIGMFVALAVTMYLTRKIDWYNTGKENIIRS